MRDKVLDEAFRLRGVVTAVARKFGISTAAVSRWKRVPESRVEGFFEITGIPASQLRPDLFEKQRPAE